MARIRVGRLELDPAKNPAVLDTTTWDPAAAWHEAQAAGSAFWGRVAQAPEKAHPGGGGVVLYPGSYASAAGRDLLLASLPDGQDLFVEIGNGTHASALGEAIGDLPLAGGRRLAAYPCDMPTLDRYLRQANPEKAPRAMGSVPRVGIGNRHTVAMWPAAYRAMERGGFAANAIQNSVRELNLLEDLTTGKPPRTNYLFSFGSISEGHTGSTFEGLLHAGVLAALREPTFPRYGADADHIQVKRGAEGLDRAKRVVESARFFTFFTLDVSDILDYEALAVRGEAHARALLDSIIRDEAERRDILAYHRRARRMGGERFSFGEADIARLIGKYWRALAAVETLCDYLKRLKGEIPFDVELSIDENPAEVATCDCITSSAELVFLAEEIVRRGLPVSHVAPNFGVEKGADYRCPDGHVGLERRVREISRLASELNLMLDCHSGDDLGRETRRIFGRATKGRINFKVSPQEQILFAETLYEVQPELFRFWWDDVYGFVEGEAARGSAFAARCLAEFGADPRPHPSRSLFHFYCFVSVGRRDDQGQFVNRERLYELSKDFLAEYTDRLEKWLMEIADDLYGMG